MEYQAAGGVDLPEQVLPDQETRVLLARAQQGDQKAKKRLVHHNLRLVLKVAHRFQYRGYELDDLVQIGVIVLL